MNRIPVRERIPETERRLLRFLCQAAADPQARAEVIERLRGYRFASVPHQVLFDCLKALPAARPELVEQLLPARLVRAGFPDFDLEPFLRPSGMSAAQARVLCQGLASDEASGADTGEQEK